MNKFDWGLARLFSIETVNKFGFFCILRLTPCILKHFLIMFLVVCMHFQSIVVSWNFFCYLVSFNEDFAFAAQPHRPPPNYWHFWWKWNWMWSFRGCWRTSPSIFTQRFMFSPFLLNLSTGILMIDQNLKCSQGQNVYELVHWC